MPRVSQVSQYGRPEYSAVRGFLFGANLTDVGILRYVCLLFPDGKNILAFRVARLGDMSPIWRILNGFGDRKTSFGDGQGPIIQVWPSGQITLTGDVIGSMGGTMRYEATMMFRGPAIKLL